MPAQTFPVIATFWKYIICNRVHLLKMQGSCFWGGRGSTCTICVCVCQNKWQLSSSEATWKLECTCILIFVCFSVMIILILRNQEGCLSGPASFLLISLQDLWLPMSWGEAPLICFELQVTYIFYQYHCTQAWGSIEQLEAQKLSWFHSVLVKLAIPMQWHEARVYLAQQRRYQVHLSQGTAQIFSAARCFEPGQAALLEFA